MHVCITKVFGVRVFMFDTNLCQKLMYKATCSYSSKKKNVIPDLHDHANYSCKQIKVTGCYLISFLKFMGVIQ